MIKKLCILLLSVCTVAPLAAQQYGSGDASFVPKKGQWQISAVIGSSQMFNQDMEYLLPEYWNGSSELPPSIGVGNNGSWAGTANQSKDPGMYLNLGNLNQSNMVNLIGIQGRYFLSDHWDINLMFSMNINATPKKDYIEGDYSVSDMGIPAYQYMEGKVDNCWNVALGSNYYFNTRNERISLYLGGVVGWQMGRISTSTPYTGETVSDPDVSDGNGSTDSDLEEGEEMPLQLYVPSSRTGQIFGLRAGVVAGIEYSVAKGLIFGFEVQPASYRYDQIQICPKGMSAYKVDHHSIGLFAVPNLKIGFRF